MDVLFKISLPFATIGLLAFIYYTFIKKQSVFTTATIASLISFICLTVILVGMMMDFGLHISFVQSSRYLIFSWLIMAIYFMAEFRYKIRLLGSILMPIAMTLMLISTFADKNSAGVTLHLGSTATLIHIALVLVGLTLLFLSFAASLLFLTKRKALKQHRSTALDERLPPLTKLKGLMEISFYAGFPALTVGLILGIVYAGSVLQNGWFWDSKIIWGLINWLIYSILFLLHQLGRVDSRALARGIVLLFTFTTISFIFTSHRLPTNDPVGEGNGEFIQDEK